MERISTLSLALATCVMIAPAAQAQQNILGDYFAYGRNPDGTAYSGTVMISDNGDGSLRVDWSVGSTYSGTGTRSGNILSVNWGSSDPAFYIIMPDGELHGTWGDGEGLELLTRTPR